MGFQDTNTHRTPTDSSWVLALACSSQQNKGRGENRLKTSMAVPKYHEMVPLTKLGGHRAGWDATSTGHGHRGCRGKLRKSSSTQNKTFSQHITFLQLHSLLGRSSQQAGQGLEAELTVKPAPGIIWLSPFPSALSGRATQGRARPLSLYTPLLPQRPRQGTAA